MPKYGDFSGPYFPAFGLKTERYEVSLRIQSECGKILTRNYSVFFFLFYSLFKVDIQNYVIVISLVTIYTFHAV